MKRILFIFTLISILSCSKEESIVESVIIFDKSDFYKFTDKTLKIVRTEWYRDNKLAFTRYPDSKYCDYENSLIFKSNNELHRIYHTTSNEKGCITVDTSEWEDKETWQLRHITFHDGTNESNYVNETYYLSSDIGAFNLDIENDTILVLIESEIHNPIKTFYTIQK